MESTLFQEWAEEFIIESEKRGEELGYKRGDENRKVKIAKKLLTRGMSFDEIMEITELPINKIKALDIS